jgi:hypothetical protein|tara:strand:- start:1316 stop:2758 length:1443 start_codon:yes stop_codon:yes gene_type:complete
MQHFYDGQIRRYVTQMVRLMSNFSYKDSESNLVTVPVMYGDITRQVGSILRDNSENKVPSVPRMGVYIQGLETDSSRISDSSFISKQHIREQKYNAVTESYEGIQGKNYTVERLHPTPYILNCNVDLWTSNTDQKLQLMEQILVLFNPTLEIQTTDNYIDWTSLTTVSITSINFSSRTIPVGTDSEIDVASISFAVPIYISPPVKVKKLGVITNIIASIHNESAGTIEADLSTPQLSAWDDSIVVGRVDRDGNEIYETSNATNVATVTYENQGIYVEGNNVKLIYRGKVGTVDWRTLFEAMPGSYEPGISQIHLRRLDYQDVEYAIVGTFSTNPIDETQIVVNWDADSLPDNTVLTGPVGDRSNVDYIIDPATTGTTALNLGSTTPRVLILNPIGDSTNTDGPDAWKNTNGTDFVAQANDIIEWDGSKWHVVFDASANDSSTDVVYITNLTTSKQYRWNNTEWLLSVDGEYPRGTWRLSL